MHVTIPNNEFIYLSNISPDEEDAVEQHFQAERPGRHYIDLVHSTWDGIYRKYHRGKKRLARPFLGELRAFCKKNAFSISIDDNRPEPEYKPVPKEEINEKLLPNITLEKYQLDGALKAYNAEVGIFDMPTGAGKTELMASICKIRQCPTVIVADLSQVVKQIKERLELREVVEEVGLFCAGKMPHGHLIIVGTVQSLVAPSKPPNKPDVPSDLPDDNVKAIIQALKKKEDYEFHKEGKKRSELGKLEKKYYDKMKKYFSSYKGYKSRVKKAKALQKLLKKAEMLIVDECDLATNALYKRIFQHWFKGRYRYGFSGTPYDEAKPVERLILQEHLGSVIHKISRRNVEKAERIIPFEYWMLAFGENGNKDDATMFDMATDEFIVYSEGFHNAVSNLCKELLTDDQDGILILVERNDLGHALKAKIPGSDFLYGSTPKNQRARILKSFEERSTNVLIGGKNVRRGLDLKGGCEELIIATGGKLSSELNQKIGRSVRKNRRGKARVWDFYFLCNKYLYGHSRQRLKTVVGMGYPSYVVFTDGTYDGEQLVKSRFRRSKRGLVTKSLF